MSAVWADEDAEAHVGGDEGANDAAIMALAQRDLHAFEPLYRRYYSSIFGFCFRRLGDREAAADATSQTFAKALAGIHGFRKGSVAAWLFTIARNVVIDTIRRRRPQTELDDADWLPDPTDGPETVALASDARRVLAGAMAHLTPDQRSVVELRLAGLSSADVAATLGMTVGAVKSSQFRAYARLRELLADQDLIGDHS